MTSQNQPPIPQIPRKSTTVPPAIGNVVTGLPQIGQFPLAAGTAVRISPMEEKMLESLGWTPGQPIPSNLPDAIAAATRQAAAAADPNGVQGIDVNAAVKNITSVDDMHPAAAEALRADMRKMTEYHQAVASAPTVPGAPASVNANITELHLQRAAQVQQAKTAAANMTNPTTEIPQRQPISPQAPPATAATKPEAPTVDTPPVSQTGLYPTYPEVCPHCHRKTLEPALTLTDEIKQNYVAALCSGDGRYYSTKELMRGHLKIQYRTATEAEVNLCQQQLLADIREQRVNSAAESTHRITEYMAIASTASITLGNNAALNIPTLTDVAATPTESVFAVVMRSIEYVLPQALLVRAWKRGYDEFQELQNALLAAMAGSDF